MLVLKYTFFAAISMLINLLFQYQSFQLHSGFSSLHLTMFIGILVGLITKCILDIKWIFYHVPKNNKDDAQKFILHSLMGVFTAITFLETEHLFASPNAKYLGGIIGLNVSYITKFYLDKYYVFIDKGELAI